jgi:hypothetical protein
VYPDEGGFGGAQVESFREVSEKNRGADGVGFA